MEHNEWVWLYTKHLSKTPLILTSDVEYLIMFEGNKAHVKLRPPRRLQAHESAESSGTETLLLAAWTKIKIPLAGSLATRRSSLGTECCYRSLGRKVWYGKLIESVTRSLSNHGLPVHAIVSVDVNARPSQAGGTRTFTSAAHVFCLCRIQVSNFTNFHVIPTWYWVLNPPSQCPETLCQYNVMADIICVSPCLYLRMFFKW